MTRFFSCARFCGGFFSVRKGELKGKLEARLEVARSLLKMKRAREAILQAMGLTEEELARGQAS